MTKLFRRFLPALMVDKKQGLQAFKLLLLLIAFSHDPIYGQITIKNTGFVVQEISVTPYSDSGGLPYTQVPGYNLGISSLQVINDSIVSYLADATGEIINVNMVDGGILSRFPVIPNAHDFVFNENAFYVFGRNILNKYNWTGEILTNTSIETIYEDAMHIVCVNQKRILVLPNGNTVGIEENSLAINEIPKPGFQCEDGAIVRAYIKDDKNYVVEWIGAKWDNTKILTFEGNYPTGSINVVGKIGNIVYVDIQNYLTKSPISVERQLIAIDFSQRSPRMVAKIIIPDVYYTYCNKGFSIYNGNIYHIISAPDGVHLFKIAIATGSSKAIDYPLPIRNLHYHYNYYLEQVDSVK